MVSVGTQMIQGLINGIKSMAGAVVSAAKGVVDGAISGAKNLLGIHSPSRVFMKIGAYTGEGMAIGLANEQDNVQKAMGKMVAPPSLSPVTVPKFNLVEADSFDARSGRSNEGVTVNVQNPGWIEPDHFGRRVGESLAVTLGRLNV